MPLIRRFSAPSTGPLCDLSSEFFNPCPDRFATHHNPSFSQQILYTSQAESKAMIRPNSIRNDGTREPVAFEAKLGNLTDHHGPLNPPDALVNNLTMPCHLIAHCLQYTLRQIGDVWILPTATGFDEAHYCRRPIANNDAEFTEETADRILGLRLLPNEEATNTMERKHSLLAFALYWDEPHRGSGTRRRQEVGSRNLSSFVLRRRQSVASRTSCFWSMTQCQMSKPLGRRVGMRSIGTDPKTCAPYCTPVLRIRAKILTQHSNPQHDRTLNRWLIQHEKASFARTQPDKQAAIRSPG